MLGETSDYWVNEYWFRFCCIYPRHWNLYFLQQDRKVVTYAFPTSNPPRELWDGEALLLWVHSRGPDSKAIAQCLRWTLHFRNIFSPHLWTLTLGIGITKVQGGLLLNSTKYFRQRSRLHTRCGKWWSWIGSWESDESESRLSGCQTILLALSLRENDMRRFSAGIADTKTCIERNEFE